MPRDLRDITYFADENALGMARVLEGRGRTDLVYPGHPWLPEVRLGAPDEEWLAVVGRANLIVVTRDRRIRTRPGERAAYREHGVRLVLLGGRRDLASTALADLLEAHEVGLRRMAVRLGAGPWTVRITDSGVRPFVDRPRG